MQKFQNKHTRYCSIFNKLTVKESKRKPVSPKDMKQLQALARLSYQVKLFLEETRPVAAVNGGGNELSQRLEKLECDLGVDPCQGHQPRPAPL